MFVKENPDKKNFFWTSAALNKINFGYRENGRKELREYYLSENLQYKYCQTAWMKEWYFGQVRETSVTTFVHLVS